MSDWIAQTAPDVTEIETMARQAMTALPEAFARSAMDVVLQVTDFASEELLDELQIDDPFELTGLYDGVPMTQKSVSEQDGGPDIIWLFRRPILDEWASRRDVTLDALVAHVVIHELAHHFGWSDEDIAKIDKWWE